ncbi:MAG: ATP-binding protein [Bacteroidota bacterium]|nr:ATP-binding protein [Bacteroidota bacterium]
MDKTQREQILKWAFSPTTPIKKEEFFKGRIVQLRKVCEAINTEGQHAIVFGERGVGKTSLANIMAESITNIYPTKVTCSRTDNFRTIWKQALEQVQYSTTTAGLGFNAADKIGVSNLTNSLNLDSTTFSFDLIRLLTQLNGTKFLFIFDEFDNITDREVRKLFADLIKSFSDNNTNTTIVLVGIANDVDKLIGSHQSLERCLKQIRMPRMSDAESLEIIEQGLSKLEITAGESLKLKIIEFASGFPHYVHLLCKYACEEVTREERIKITENDLKFAISQGIDNTNEQLKSAYRKASIGLSTTNKWKDVLFSCAEAKIDEYNCFSIPEILLAYKNRTGKDVKGGSISYNLNQLCLKERGDILEKLDTGLNTRYRFVNPMMMAYIKLMISTE